MVLGDGLLSRNAQHDDDDDDDCDVTLACRIGFRYLHFAPFLAAGGSASLSGSYTLSPANAVTMILLFRRKAHNPAASTGSDVLRASVARGDCQFNDVKMTNF